MHALSRGKNRFKGKGDGNEKSAVLNEEKPKQEIIRQ